MLKNALSSAKWSMIYAILPRVKFRKLKYRIHHPWSATKP